MLITEDVNLQNSSYSIPLSPPNFTMTTMSTQVTAPENALNLPQQGVYRKIDCRGEKPAYNVAYRLIVNTFFP